MFGYRQLVVTLLYCSKIHRKELIRKQPVPPEMLKDLKKDMHNLPQLMVSILKYHFNIYYSI